ncbi:MAG: hypothetical protein RLZZ490_1523 [Cyanobacteriota bacterium]
MTFFKTWETEPPFVHIIPSPIQLPQGLLEYLGMGIS